MPTSKRRRASGIGGAEGLKEGLGSVHDMIRESSEEFRVIRESLREEHRAINESSRRASTLLRSFESDSFPSWHRRLHGSNSPRSQQRMASLQYLDGRAGVGNPTDEELLEVTQAATRIQASFRGKAARKKTRWSLRERTGQTAGSAMDRARAQMGAQGSVHPAARSKASKLAFNRGVKAVAKAAGQGALLAKSGFKRDVKTLLLVDDDLGTTCEKDMVAWINHKLDEMYNSEAIKVSTRKRLPFTDKEGVAPGRYQLCIYLHKTPARRYPSKGKDPAEPDRTGKTLRDTSPWVVGHTVDRVKKAKVPLVVIMMEESWCPKARGFEAWESEYQGVVCVNLCYSQLDGLHGPFMDFEARRGLSLRNEGVYDDDQDETDTCPANEKAIDMLVRFVHGEDQAAAAKAVKEHTSERKSKIKAMVAARKGYFGVSAGSSNSNTHSTSSTSRGHYVY
eukprot:g99.t1